MIPHDLAKKSVEFSRLAANDEEYAEFMRIRHNRMKYYKGDTEKLTRGWFSKNLLKNVPIANINIFKRIIDRTSEVYMVEALREAGSESQTEKYKSMIPRKHERMQRIEKMTNALDVVCVHPYYDHNNKVLDHMILLEFQPFFDMNGNMVGIRYPLMQSANTSAIDEQSFVEWGLEGWRIVDSEGRAQQKQAYNGVFPFKLAWADEPEYFYDHLPTPDLAQGNLCINFYRTNLNANNAYQAHGQPFITGLNSSDDFQWGIDKIPALPEGATAQILSPPSTAQDTIAVEKSIYKLIARNYHLPEDFVEGSAQAESGVAIKLRNQELQNERIGDIIRWRNFEHEIYKIERDILSKAGVSVSEEFAVDFSETTEYLSEDEQRAKDDWDLEHNLTTIVDIAMRENPDLTREDAEALIEANKEANATKGETGLADILGTPPE